MTYRHKFIKYFFSQINDFQYVLLKHIDQSVMDIDDSCDLDLLILKEDLEAFLSLINTFEGVKKIHSKDLWTMHQMFVFFRDNSYLQLDFLFGFYRKEIVYLNKENVFSLSKINHEGVRVCDDYHLLEHLLVFNFLNFSGIPEKYIVFFEKLAPIEKESILAFINSKYQLNLGGFIELKNYTPQIRILLSNCLLKRTENQGFSKLINAINYYFDAIKGVQSSRGFMMTFSGVDGSGKSTIIQNVKGILESKYRRNVVVLRHRPSIFPILSAYRYGKAKAEQRSVNSMPRQGKNKSSLSSLIRFSYYYLDYLLGQFYVKTKYIWRGYVVIYDRYYFDFIVDGKRSNIQLSKAIPQFLYRFVAHPALNLFLYAKPEIILKRKQELNPESIKELTLNYKTLFKKLANKSASSQYLPIENINQNRTIKKIFEQYEAMI